MIRAREIRIALVGALLFVVAGTVQGCASDVSAPESLDARLQANAEADDQCFQSNGVWYCR